jgi:hypothetical protein
LCQKVRSKSLFKQSPNPFLADLPYRPFYVNQGKTKSAMLQMDNPESTDGERHRPETASLKSLGVP